MRGIFCVFEDAFAGKPRSYTDHAESVGARLAREGRASVYQSLAVDRPGFLVCNKCENTACKSSDALSSSRLSLLSM
ncbi:hypothetical protein FQ192_22830 [Pseudomonas sp. ANT_J12]|nr:hypothetical protein FQ192_22830 [Pseudomonas sp. ANT_J12]